MVSSNWGQFFGNPSSSDINAMMTQADKDRANYERRASAVFMLKTLYSEIDKTSVYKGAGVIYIYNKDTTFKLREIAPPERQGKSL